MDAKDGVRTDRNALKDKLLRLALQMGELGEDTVKRLDLMVQASLDRVPWTAELRKPSSLDEFLVSDNPTEGVFNQLWSERWAKEWWMFLGELERLDQEVIAKAQDLEYITGRWQNEVVTENLFRPPKDWTYLPVGDAVAALQNIFGSSMKANSVINQAKQFQPWEHAEGWAVCPSLIFLFNWFEIPRQLGISEKVRPWEDSKDGRAAYSKILDCLVSEKEDTKRGILKKAYRAVYEEFNYRNFREDKLGPRYVWLTPDTAKAWQELESRKGEDDFVVFPANSGFLRAGHSVRWSWLKNIFCQDLFGQCGVMVASTLTIQPERLAAYEHLNIDCSGNKYSPDAVGHFLYSLFFNWSGGFLSFGGGWAVDASRDFGSALGRLGQ